jgi:hypothetical protein
MCAYNPGVTDISGQLRAQGMMAGSQALAQGIGNAFQEYKANEEKRRLANAATKGILAANPDALQGLLQDPEMAKLWGKKQAGKSSLSDDLQFAGALTTYGQAKQEKTAQQFREMQLKREQDVEQRRADAFKALKEADANGYQGIDPDTAEAMKTALHVSSVTGKLPDPDALLTHARYLKQQQLDADKAAAMSELKNREGEFIYDAQGNVMAHRNPDGSIHQWTQPKTAAGADNPIKDGTRGTAPDGRPIIWSKGQQIDAATGQPLYLTQTDPISGEKKVSPNGALPPVKSGYFTPPGEQQLSKEELDALASGGKPAANKPASKPDDKKDPKKPDTSRFRITPIR